MRTAHLRQVLVCGALLWPPMLSACDEEGAPDAVETSMADGQVEADHGLDGDVPNDGETAEDLPVLEVFDVSDADLPDEGPADVPAPDSADAVQDVAFETDLADTISDEGNETVVNDVEGDTDVNPPVPAFVQFYEHAAKTKKLVPLEDGSVIAMDAVRKYTGGTFVHWYWFATRFDAGGKLMWSVLVDDQYLDAPTQDTWDVYVNGTSLVVVTEAGTVSYTDLSTGEPVEEPSTSPLTLPGSLSATYEPCPTGGQVRVESGATTGFLPLPFTNPYLRTTPHPDQVAITLTENRKSALFVLPTVDLEAGVLPSEFGATSCSQPPPKMPSCIEGLAGADDCGWADIAGATVHGGFVGLTDCAAPEVRAVDDAGNVAWSYVAPGGEARLLDLGGGPLLLTEDAAGVLLTALDGGDGSVRWTNYYPGVIATSADADGVRAAIVIDQAANPVPHAPQWLVVADADGVVSDLKFSFNGTATWRVAIHGDLVCTDSGPTLQESAWGHVEVGISGTDCYRVLWTKGVPPFGKINVSNQDYPDETILSTHADAYFGALTSTADQLLVFGSQSFGYLIEPDGAVVLGEFYPHDIVFQDLAEGTVPHPLLRRVSDTYVAMRSIDGWRATRWDLGLCKID